MKRNVLKITNVGVISAVDIASHNIINNDSAIYETSVPLSKMGLC